MNLGPSAAVAQPAQAAASRIDIRRVARALRALEDGGPESAALLREAHGQARTVPVIGVTGPPGAGKSTLLDRLALQWADAGLQVGLLLVDPSSPFSGGALLGDRCRLEGAGAHPNVFVRSLASRGQVGGLSGAVLDATVLFGALGFDLVLVETVGSGQSDLEIAELADCVVVVSVPGLGDQVQAAKAGILEIGDVYAVNKSDLPGADTVAAHLRANADLVYPAQEGVNEPDGQRPGGATLPGNAALHARHGRAGAAASCWRPPVLRVSATRADGITALRAAIDSFVQWQRDTGRDCVRRAGRLRRQVLRLAGERLQHELAGLPQLDGLLEAVGDGRSTPEEAATELLEALLRNGGGPAA